MKHAIFGLICFGLLLTLLPACKKDLTDIPETPNVVKNDTSMSFGLQFLTPEQYKAVPEAPQSKIPNLMGENQLETRAMASIVRLNTPPVRTQGGEGSCTAFAIGYAGLSYFINLINREPYTDEGALRSPEFLYNITKLSDDCGAGSYMTKVLDALVQKGVCSWAAMPYTSGSCSEQPSASHYEVAARAKLATYYRLSPQLVKHYLNYGYPIAMGFAVDDNFYAQTDNAPYVYTSMGGNYHGNHAVLIVGYDDAKNAYIVQNSWGNWRHDGGYFYISYDLFPAMAQELYVMLPKRNAASPVHNPNQFSSCAYTGDIDGDGSDDLITFNGSRITITNAEFEHKPILTADLGTPIKRLIIGDFANSGRERGSKQIGAILTNGTTRVFAISDNKKELWWWFTQGTFIEDNEQFVAANFDEDIADELMVHNPATGRIRFFKKPINGFFNEMQNFDLGNLGGNDPAGTSLANTQILVGSFSADHANRKDLLVVNRATGQMRLYASVWQNNRLTFWWAFTTHSGLFHPSDQLCVANLNGANLDGLIKRSGTNFNYKLYKVEYGNGWLVPETVVNVGQLPFGQRHLVAAKVRPVSMRNELGGRMRDDILSLDWSNNQLTYTTARFDGQQLLYWWAYHRPLDCAR